ncbi:MAG TPA: hypothetical protein VIA18_03350 [Polyangia bacterium]|jgi:hypothetical protein|nr:hypothetical protein [Polyangia bacterium]
MTTTTKLLPVRLESLRIATPCSADWQEMKGDDYVRFCGRCEKNVYDLSALSREAAEQLVAEKEGRMCVRFYQRADGTVLTNDCPVGVRRERLRQRIWNRIAGAATSAALLVGLWSGRARADLAVGDGKTTATTKEKPHAVMAGGISAPKPPAEEPPLMGKIAAPKKTPEPPQPMMGAPVAPPKKQAPTPQPTVGVLVPPPAPVMGEPQMVQGDIAPPPAKAKTTKKATTK